MKVSFKNAAVNVFDAILVWLVEIKREPIIRIGKEQMLRLSPAT